MNKPKIYLGGDIMTKGSKLAREEEYQQVMNANINADIYSPIKNDSINDKSAMTKEENDHLAEKIVKADIDRLWDSDAVVMCPEQHAIGSMCETGVLYGWKYMANYLKNLILIYMNKESALDAVWDVLTKLENKNVYYHYDDIRTNNLDEKNFRRSFGINQMLYGMMILSTTGEAIKMTDNDNKGVLNMEQIIEILNNKYGEDDMEVETDNGKKYECRN